MREIVKYWRGKGFKIIMYLDDGLGGATYYEKALSTSKIIKSDLEQFGFHIAEEKCIWTPNTACVEIICPTILAMNLTLKSTIPLLYCSIKLARKS
jgi:hypothetical protein